MTTLQLVTFILTLMRIDPTHAPKSQAARTKMARTVAPIVLSEQARIHDFTNPKLLVSLIQPESSWDPLAVNPSGAVGLFQVMPSHRAAKKYTLAQLLTIRINTRVALQIIHGWKHKCRLTAMDAYQVDDPRIWLSAYNGLGCHPSVYAEHIVKVAGLADNS